MCAALLGQGCALAVPIGPWHLIIIILVKEGEIRAVCL